MARLWLALIALTLALAPGSVQAKKVALIVANSGYEMTSSLPNTQNDAVLVGNALGEAGFDTVTVERDLNFANFQQVLRKFRDDARGADVALLYYAGHGIEGRGQNWLIPVDASLRSEGDLPYEAVELQLAMDALEGAELRIMVLDACRNNPYANQWRGASRSTTQGLARVEVDDVLVIYAAAPGMVAYEGDGQNSPFARALARRLQQPEIPVQMLGGMVRDDVLATTDGEQRPFISASITGQPIYLSGGGNGQFAKFAAVESGASMNVAGGGLKATRSVDVAGNAIDSQMWEAAMALNTVEAFELYVQENPDGRFRRFAELNIDKLSNDRRAVGGKNDAADGSRPRQLEN